MDNKEAGDLPDVVLLDVQRFGASEDMQSVLLLCNAQQRGQRGALTVMVPMFTAPNLVTALLSAQAVAAELQAASSASPTMPRPLLAAGVTAAEMPSTSPTSAGAMVVSFLLGGAWLHLQLSRPDALALQAHLARLLGPG